MKRSMRVLSLVMSLLLFVALLPVDAKAADEEYQDAQIISAGSQQGLFPGGSVSNEASDVTTYTPSSSSGLMLIMNADGKNWILPLADNTGKTLDYKVTSCTSSDTGIATVKVVDGKCVATSKKAGIFTVTIRSSSCNTVWNVLSRFTDVTKTGDYFYNPIYWALNFGITTGTSATKFSPYGACTRAQIVTFLYRFANSPAVASTTYNPFTDIKSSDYYYKPVLWAYNNGITTGTSPTTFSPNKACTREQCVTFLWRYKGKPSASASSKFTDVSSSQYYAQAVSWAVDKGVTVGVSSTKFGVGQKCTRGQIVTFLYRCP